MTRIILLSGWGIDARVWQALAPHWPQATQVSAPDWPGYGTRPAAANPHDIGELAHAMAAELPADALWVGWSLGGLLAAALLAQVPPPRGLVLLGVGPRFCHPEGVTPDELGRFRRAFARDPLAAWRHFLRWQLQGEPAPGDALRRLRGLIGDSPRAAVPVLAAGLAQLAELDLRPTLQRAAHPLWQVAGSHDPLLAAENRLPTRLTLDACGHCPMVSAPARLAQALHALALAACGSSTEPTRPMTEAWT